MIRQFSLVAAATLLTSPALACDGLTMQDPYARASTPMSTSGAAFMVLVNTGDTDCHVTGVHSDAAQRTELHTHLQGENGVMRMVHVEEGFIVPAVGELALERGGKHVMFMGLTAPFDQGNILTVTLEFEGGGEHSFDVPVDLQRMPGQMPSH